MPALLLRGYEPRGLGTIVTVGRPRWATGMTSSRPSPLRGHGTGPPRTLTADDVAALDRVYRYRPRLVHGAGGGDSAQAMNDAEELAKAVVRTALESDWPDARALDAAAQRRE